MSNTLNHTSSRQIVRHYTHRQKRRKHLMQYFVSANGLFELKVKVYAFLFDVILGNDSNLLIVFYVQIMPDDFVMQLHR
ncbi:hypothetical protein QU878_23100, partial [Escherichia coli]